MFMSGGKRQKDVKIQKRNGQISPTELWILNLVSEEDILFLNIDCVFLLPLLATVPHCRRDTRPLHEHSRKHLLEHQSTDGLQRDAYIQTQYREVQPTIDMLMVF